MLMTDVKLQVLESMAYSCDGEPWSVFEDSVLPTLAKLSEGELWALSGMFLSRGMVEAATIIASYADTVRSANIHEKERPDPRRWLEKKRAEPEEVIPF